MKPRIRHLLIFVLLMTTSLSNSVFSYRDSKCELVEELCQYEGILNNIDIANEEFEMLLESPLHPNFENSFYSLLYFLNCVNKNLALMKQQPNCKALRYLKKLISFYQAHKTELKNNISNVSIEIANELDALIPDIKARLLKV